MANNIPSIDHGMLSPSGSISKRARSAALKKEASRLFPAGFWAPPAKSPEQIQAERIKSLTLHADRLRNLADAGMNTRKYRKEIVKIEAEIKAMEGRGA